MATKAFLKELRRKHGLGEFSKKGKSRAPSQRKARKGGGSMGKKRRSSSRGGFGSFGGMGMLKNVAIGVGVGSLMGGLIGVGGAYVLGGIPAAAGAYFAPQIRSTLSGINGGSNGGGF